ncbi:hypothetical protein ABIF65_008269 [Bradyrhizobium japonicum]
MLAQKVAIWSGASLNNAGDRQLAAVTAAELRVRLPGAVFRHFCPWSHADDPIPLWIDERGRWPGSKKFDAVVVAGGGVFSGPPFQHPIMQIFCLGRHPSLFDPETVVAWHGVGAQERTPIHYFDGAQVQYLDEFLQRADYVAVRDDLSARKLRNIKATRILTIPDPVFSLPPAPQHPRYCGGRPRIALIPGSSEPSQRLRQQLANQELRDRCPGGAPICVEAPAVSSSDRKDYESRKREIRLLLGIGLFLSELARHAEIDIISDDNIYADDEFSLRLQALVPGVHLRSSGGVETHHALTHHMEPLIRDYDIILASRYHAAILALRLGKPLVLIDTYRHTCEDETKLRTLSRLLRSPKRYWAPLAGERELDVDTYDTSDLIASVMGSLRDYEYCALSYESEHRRARQSFDDLGAFLASRKRKSINDSVIRED